MWENVSTIPQEPQVPRISKERKFQVAFASFYWKFCQYTISVYSECYKSVIIILKSLVYTKTVDNVFRALWLATQSVTVLQQFTDSPPVPPSERRQTRVSCEQGCFALLSWAILTCLRMQYIQTSLWNETQSGMIVFPVSYLCKQPL